MVRVPFCDQKPELKKGPWTPEEDQKLVSYIQNHGHSSWRALPKQAGLSRCGKSCRLRWSNYLRPGIKRGNFSSQEENSIIQLHAVLGNRWSTIATHLPGRTDNEIKNHWNTRLRKRLLKMGIDPATHRPWPQQPPNPLQAPSINPLGLLSLLQGLPSASHSSPLVTSLLLGSNAFSTNSLLSAASAHIQPHTSTSLPTPPSSSYPVSAVDPALLAAAETRLVLDCLKFNTTQNNCTSSDDQLNQVLTRLLLVKLLQSSNSNAGVSSNPAPCNDSKALIHNIIAQNSDQRSSRFAAADHLLYNQGMQPAPASMLPAGMNRLINEAGAAAPASSSAYVQPNTCVAVNNNTHNSLSPSILFSGSSYQQRLLQTLPFLAESLIESSTSAAATEHLSSNQLSQANFINVDTLTPTNGSLTSHHAPLWPAGHRSDNQMLPSGAQLLAAAAGVTQANHHHHNAMSSVPTLMTWEELLMTQHRGGDRDPASSSTANTTGSSTRSCSSASAAPNTPTTNFNIPEYWSNLLNLISSSNNHPLSTESD